MFQQKAERIALQRFLRLVGLAVVLASLYFIGQRFWTYRAELATLDFSRVWVPATIGVWVYTGAGYLLAESWRRLLGWFGETKTDWRACYRIYAQTQIAKYLPGNVFHVGSRHVMGRQLAMGHVALAGAAVYEILGLLSMGGSIALVGFVVFRSGNQVAFSVWLLLVGVLLFPFVFNALAARVPFLQRFRTAASARDVFRNLVPVYTLYIIYFLVVGGILLGIVYSTSVIVPSERLRVVPVVLSAFAVAWMLGLITPGAPAGVGVREAVLVSILAPFIGEVDSLMAVIILRVVTLLGDFLFFLTSFVMREYDK